jgi:membrane-associated phospholipid phosphatase
MRRARACLFLLVWLAAIVPCAAQAPEPSPAPPASDAPQSSPQAVPTPTPTPAPPLVPGPGTHVQPDDKRRTMRSYLHNLAYDFVAVVQKDNRESLLLTAAFTVPAFGPDHDFKQYFIDHPHDTFGSVGEKLGGTVAIAGLSIGIFSAGRISRGDTFRSASYDLSQAIIITQVYTQALKLATQRERPDASNNLSFPSGHASNAFAMASVIARHYKKLAIPAYAFGTFVAVSRLAANKHYFSDIVAGSGLGVSVGRAVFRRNGRPPDPKPDKIESPPPEKASWDITPWAGPSGDGHGLALVVRF